MFADKDEGMYIKIPLEKKRVFYGLANYKYGYRRGSIKKAISEAIEHFIVNELDKMPEEDKELFMRTIKKQIKSELSEG